MQDDTPPRFRIQARRVLLTFSQTDVYPVLAEVMGYHLAFLREVDYYIVGHERHADGGHHHHIVIVFSTKFDSTNPRVFDWMFDGIHPNIRSIKHTNADIKRAIDYCKKEGDWIDDGNSPLAQKVKPMESITKMIRDGASLEEIEDAYPGPFIMHDQRVQRAWQRWNARQSAVSKWVPIQAHDPFSELYPLQVWLNANISVERDFRQKHLWLHGPTKIGKSRMVFALSEMVKTFIAPTDGWMTGYNDSFDLVIFDDFRGCLTVDFFKQFCQSFPYQVLQKGLPPVLKKKHVPCIVTSNVSPIDCYPNVAVRNPLHFEAFLDRFIVVEIKSPFVLF